MTHKDKDFKKLQAKWYKKLEVDGFNDIEQDEDALKHWSLTKSSQPWFNPINNASKQEYYRLAGHFLYDHPFETKLERAVWAYHAEGVSIREMVIKLKASGFKVYRDKVHSIIKRLSKLMVQRVR